MSTSNPWSVATARFGLGPDPSGAAPTGDARAWVESQIGVSATAGLDPDLPPGAENARRWRIERNIKVARKKQLAEAARLTQAGLTVPPVAPAAPGGPQPARWMRPGEELRSRLQRTVTQKETLPERLTLFWADYFTVSVSKSTVLPLAGPFEREALRPFIFAPFRVLLGHAVTHPAMLFYLDNDQSMGPQSPAGRQKKRGLNENLAREILELHTLGSTGGYTQKDVTSFAAVLSGWSVMNNPAAETCGQSQFLRARHEPGAKVLLGKTYPDVGAEQLALVLDDLARHPATAQHVATRMCRAFICETPPPQLVARMAETFRRTDGDLAAVVRVMVRADEAWTVPPRKLRSPTELLHVVTRLLGAAPEPPAVAEALVAMGQPYFNAPSPKGWPDEDNAWTTADGIKTRLDWARGVGARFQHRVDARRLMEGPLHGLLSDETRTTVLQAESQEQALALLIMSPELQRR
ncbi:DUF1800 domain-containing protein [Xanthobacter agilis]|uniref:DUF1800 domain-containing protein n=1 Tax=Xanthobacter agilis TaxID=47492 RepID=UPI003729F3F0